MRLKDKVAIVTGATRGVGRGIAHRFAAEGARVVVTGRTPTAGRQVEAEIRDAGGEACFVQTDIAREEDCRDLIAATERAFGPLTTFVHNAAATHLVGTGRPGSDARMHLVPNEAMAELWQSDLFGTFWLYRYALRAMLAHGRGGAIVNVSSGAGSLGALDMDAYVASKAAMNGVTRSMAAEYARDNIRVNAIGTGLVNNGGAVQAMLDDERVSVALKAGIPLPVMGMPDDIAWAAVYLASDEARYVTGVVLPVDGGIAGASAFRHAPLQAA